MSNWLRPWLILGTLLLPPCAWAGASEPLSQAAAKVDAYVTRAWQESSIPGLSLAVVDGESVFLKGYGLASLETRQPVTPDTLFEIGSCTKAFTGLALARLRAETGLDDETPVARYLPLFFGIFEGRETPISLGDLLHHTSGIPDTTILRLPAGDQAYALKKTVLGVSGLDLGFSPGSRFAYATVNYDIAAQVLQVLSGMDYGLYLTERVLKPLGLNDSMVAAQAQAARTHPQMASGYKAGFFTPRPYVSPVFRGNFPAGYVISNGRDMARWLRLQLGLEESPLSSLIRQTQEPNRKVKDEHDDYYAMGWYMTQKGLIHHAGVNPSFTAFVGFDPGRRKGLAVLTNCNSNVAEAIGWGGLAILLDGDAPLRQANPDTAVILDRYASIACLVLGLFSLVAGVIIIFTLWRVLSGRRGFGRPGPPRLAVFGLSLFSAPVIAGLVANLPELILGRPMETSAVWMPISLPPAVRLLLAAWFLGLAAVNLVLLFPRRPEAAV